MQSSPPLTTVDVEDGQDVEDDQNGEDGQGVEDGQDIQDGQDVEDGHDVEDVEVVTYDYDCKGHSKGSIELEAPEEM